MLPGYNHNIRYREQVFHVQTEDSGVENPHIITHLFFGGNIIESRKTSYGDIVHSDRLKELLVDLMQDQHKGMLRDLIKGRMDEQIKVRSANAATLSGPAPLNVEAGGQHRDSFGFGSVSRPAQPTPIAAPKPPPLPQRPVVPPPAPIAGAPPPAAPGSMAASAGSNELIIEAETLQKAFESKNESAVDSIFGEDLISEKSLDEVILSYLAEDMLRDN